MRMLKLNIFFVLAGFISIGCLDDVGGLWGEHANQIPDLYKVVNLTDGTSIETISIPDLLTNDIYKTTHMVLKYIPAGKPGVVNIAKGFYMGVFEVTQKQWQLVKGNWPSSFTTNPDKLPVESITWDDICSSGGFLNYISSQTELNFRLPTETEWEYAARAGTSSHYAYGYTANGAYMWYQDNSGGQTHEVGTRLPNPWGLYDMHGNVKERCDTIYDDLDGYCVIRAGSWDESFSFCWLHMRYGTPYNSRHRTTGVRVLIEP